MAVYASPYIFIKVRMSELRKQIGTYFVLNNYDPETHTRSYATTAFYTPVKDRPNFTVLVTAPVNKIISETGDKGDLTASGVEFEFEGKTYNAYAHKEVILCAGLVLRDSSSWTNH